MEDFHTQNCADLTDDITTRGLPWREFYERTLCIMMVVSIENETILATPIVMSLVANPVLRQDIRSMVVDLSEALFDRDEGFGAPTIEVRWRFREMPDGVKERTLMTDKNACALLRYLKERGSIDSLVLTWERVPVKEEH